MPPKDERYVEKKGKLCDLPTRLFLVKSLESQLFFLAVYESRSEFSLGCFYIHMNMQVYKFFS